MNAAGSIASAGLRADAVVDLRRRVELDAEVPLHEPGGRLLERRDAVVGVAAVLGPVDLARPSPRGRAPAAISSFSPMPKSISCRSGCSASAFRLARLIFSNL